MSGTVVLAVVLAAALAGASGSADATRSGWAVQRVCSATDTSGFHLNNSGDVIWTDQTSPQFSMGFLWRRGKRIQLGRNESTANALNDNGQVVGWTDRVKGGGYLWDKGRFVRLLTRPGNLVPMGLDAAGDVVGALEPQDDTTYASHAFIWRKNHLDDLGAVGRYPTVALLVDERRRVVGTAADRTGAFRLFRSSLGKVEPLETPGWVDLWPIALTNDERIFGTARRGNPRGAPGEVDFLWSRGRMIDLGVLGGRRSDASAMNARGQVVGWYLTRTGTRHAFLWERGVLRDLGAGGAAAVNDYGDVVGTKGVRGFLWRKGQTTDLGRITPIAVNDRDQILARSGSGIVLLTPR